MTTIPFEAGATFLVLQKKVTINIFSTSFSGLYADGVTAEVKSWTDLAPPQLGRESPHPVQPTLFL